MAPKPSGGACTTGHTPKPCVQQSQIWTFVLQTTQPPYIFSNSFYLSPKGGHLTTLAIRSLDETTSLRSWMGPTDSGSWGPGWRTRTSSSETSAARWRRTLRGWRTRSRSVSWVKQSTGISLKVSYKYFYGICRPYSAQIRIGLKLKPPRSVQALVDLTSEGFGLFDVLMSVAKIKVNLLIIGKTPLTKRSILLLLDQEEVLRRIPAGVS